MLQRNKLLSVALVAIMAFTVVSGVGMPKAQAYPPAVAELPGILDCQDDALLHDWGIQTSYLAFLSTSSYTPVYGDTYGNTERLQLLAQQVPGVEGDHEEAKVTVITEGPCVLNFNWQAGPFGSTDQVQYTCSWGPVGGVSVGSVAAQLDGYNHNGYAYIDSSGPLQITWTFWYKTLAQPNGKVVWGYLDEVRRDSVGMAGDPFSPPSKDSVVTDSAGLNAEVKAMSRADIRPGTATPLLANINAVQQQIALGRYDAAAKLLKNTVLTRMDGYATKGAPDNNDFVTSHAAQAVLSMKVQELITDLTWLQTHPS